MIHQHVKSTFRIHEAVVLSGFTKYMLDYLAREEIFGPRGSEASKRGRRRLYTFEDLVLLRALHKICVDKGKIKHLRQALAVLRDEIGSLDPGQPLDQLLFVQGSELCLRTGREGGRQLRSGQLTFGFVVDLRSIAEELTGSVQADRQTGVIKLRPDVALLAEEERARTWAPIRSRRVAHGA
jgi:hypothetical protein